jgi:hypothetical protein
MSYAFVLTPTNDTSQTSQIVSGSRPCSVAIEMLGRLLDVR